MQKDDLIWKIIGEKKCAHRKTTEKHVFCGNKYSVTGACNREDCPLANGKYATVVEIEDACVLLRKTIERAHCPRDQWDRIILPADGKQAQVVIAHELEWWDKQAVRKCVRRERSLRACVGRRKEAKKHVSVLEPRRRKEEKVERRRERKAAKVARIEAGVKRGILANLDRGVYGRIHARRVSEWEREQARLQQEMVYSEESGEYTEDTEEEVVVVSAPRERDLALVD
ncbi:MAG: MAK16 protein [Amphiamblys sp. WSBS2006]|nr:MAG: MAK16 protein [Amphiamblys sp. WSBS2006]